MQRSLRSGAIASVSQKQVSGLKQELLPHQKRALKWMLLREKKTPSGGIFADDMGLGKTLTTLSLILSTLNGRKKNCAGNLVICPLSLIKMWENEVCTCCVRGCLSILKFNEASEKITTEILSRYTVVLVSYNKLRKSERSNPIFKVKWSRIILDEAHVIRNSEGDTCQAVCQLQGVSKWAVTATPIHKNEKDLYALLKFIGLQGFDDMEVWKNIVNDKNGADYVGLIVELRTIVLRRTKDELRNEGERFFLPEKRIHVIEAKLDEKARTVYNKVLERNRKKNPKKTNFIRILRLRQICCDVSLIAPKLYSKSGRGSNKIQLVVEKTKEILRTHKKDKIIIVSEWVKLLNVVEIELRSVQNANCKLLTGNTEASKRQEIVKKINNPNNHLNVLLLTFNAGGVGLNLIGANHLLLIELHWNPHLEAQMQDRVYRFGQKKPVHIYKFLCKDTIEEDIQANQAKKLQIASNFFHRICDNNDNCRIR